MRSTGGRERLDREVVVSRALAVADAEGLEALTIRRLAQDLGVTPMALYWHFSNKDELLDGIAEYLFTQVTLPEPAVVPWADELRAALAAFIAALRPHPAVSGLAQARILSSAAGLRLAERALGLLHGAGFPVEQAAEIGGYLISAVVTLVAAEPGVGQGHDEDTRDNAARSRKATLLSLSPSEFPNVIASAHALTFCENDEAYYTRGLDLLIAGVHGLVSVD